MSHCSACQTPLYCSKECQKIDWAQRHKALCKSRVVSALAVTLRVLVQLSSRLGNVNICCLWEVAES
jgi:hypothetical protein